MITTVDPDLALTLIAKYEALGLRLIFFDRDETPEGKGPTSPGWATRHYDASNYRHGQQIGVLTGTAVGEGRYQFDVDVDWSPGVRVVDRFLPRTLTFGRTSKPFSHALFTASHPVRSRKYEDLNGDTLIELRGTKDDGTIGHQSMIAPSWHVRAKECIEIMIDAPLTHDDTVPVRTSYIAVAFLLGRHWLPNGDLTPQHDMAMHCAGLLCACDVPGDMVVLIVEAAAELGGDDNVADRRKAAESTVRRYAQGEPITGAPSLAKLLKQGKDLAKLIRSWLVPPDGFRRTETWQIIATDVDNIERAVTGLGWRLQYDQFARKSRANDNKTIRPIDDDFERMIRFDVHRKYRFLPSKELLSEVIADIAHRNSVHPVKTYFAKLPPWDGEPRLDRWLVTFGGAVDEPLTRAIGAIVLIAAVRRILQPGCKFDELMILVGEQGKNKSTALRTLCPVSDWFTDDFPLYASPKELIEVTDGRWIVEASELTGIRTTKGTEHIKSMLSRQVDIARMSYDRKVIERPRQFIPVGSINNEAFLKDMTGGRRFWPIRVQQFNVTDLLRDRDQLWAEAVYREARDESIRLDESYYGAAAALQERSRVVDGWEDILYEYLADVPASLNDDPPDHTNIKWLDRVPCAEIWAALGVEPSRQTQEQSERVFQIMDKFGYSRKPMRGDSGVPNKDGVLRRWVLRNPPAKESPKPTPKPAAPPI